MRIHTPIGTYGLTHHLGAEPIRMLCEYVKEGEEVKPLCDSDLVWNWDLWCEETLRQRRAMCTAAAAAAAAAAAGSREKVTSV